MSKYYVTQRDLNGVLKIVEEFDDFEDFFYTKTESQIRDDFRNTDVVRVETMKWRGSWGYLPFKDYAKVLYNSKHKLVPVDVIIGEFRKYREKQISQRSNKYYRRRQGRKKSAYGWLRHIRTYNEKKWTHAWDDEEFAPPTRGKRTGHNLPDAWDEYWAQTQKCWKRQSKRKHQWYRIKDLSCG